ncbi:hypothetical protein F5144DRAFT_62624 [Chaetomium tenue]|uniref:Uncharacterized protein n=1 Tax=Chaetomium tenue TaxID=1854479 RepID=A0ACB7PR41_9PEZI|nr:hypothetical protein F5144DRAFT_62624 [Chaetomium globosum]
MDPKSCCSHKNPGAVSPVPSRRSPFSDILDITVSSFCSLVTWEYTTQNEIPQSPVGVTEQNHGAENPAGAFIFRPSPGLMLFSCLVFGCCVSSFAHRRQSQDPFQFIIYLILLSCAAMIGYAAGAPVYLILLGYLPWATCAAMAISVSSRGVYRCLRPQTAATGQGDEEKARFLG